MRVIITNKQIIIFSNNANNQSITMYPFLVDKKLRVCRQEVNFLPTNSQLLVDKKFILCNTLIISSKFPLCKRSVCTHILLAFHMSLTDFA